MALILLFQLVIFFQQLKNVSGFQDYVWGAPRSLIIHDLKKDQVPFQIDDEKNVAAQTKFYFDDFPYDVQVEQVFRFYNDSLRAVQYFYRFGIDRSQIDTVFNRVKRILVTKYGTPLKDNFNTDDAYPFHYVEWKFPSTQIDLIKQYDEKKYKSEVEVADEYVRISYWSQYFSKRIDDDKRQSMKRKF
jgi:hypothetical protein